MDRKNISVIPYNEMKGENCFHGQMTNYAYELIDKIISDYQKTFYIQNQIIKKYRI